MSVPGSYSSPSFPFLVSLISKEKCFNILFAVCFVTVEMLSGFPYRCVCQVISRRIAVLVPLSVFKVFCLYSNKSSTSFSSNGTMLTGIFLNSCCCCCCYWCCFETRSYFHCCYWKNKILSIIFVLTENNSCCGPFLSTTMYSSLGSNFLN